VAYNVSALSLFDHGDRDYLGPSAHSESSFSILNRSARPEAQAIRAVLDAWFSRFPQQARADLWARFCRSDYRQHLAAFFELYCHALLTAQGFDVEAHPKLPGARRTRPDFIARSGPERRPVFYFE